MSDKRKFTATDKAIKALKAALEKRKTPEAALRIGVKGGGCSGYMYSLEFCDQEPGEKDLTFEFDGSRIIIDKKSILFLNGAELDYEITMMERGFKFNNPLAKSDCGCKESFSVD